MINEALFKEYSCKMREYQSLKPDAEYRHIVADRPLCELLEKLGYQEAAKLFEEMERFYS